MPAKRILQTVCTGPSKVASGSDCVCAPGYVADANSTGQTTDELLWCIASCDATSTTYNDSANTCVCNTGF